MGIVSPDALAVTGIQSTCNDRVLTHIETLGLRIRNINEQHPVGISEQENIAPERFLEFSRYSVDGLVSDLLCRCDRFQARFSRYDTHLTCEN
jgi:hypothetical protein